MIITEACIENLRRTGSETLEMPGGEKVELVYQKEDAGPPPGHRGKGFYIADEDPRS